MANAEKGQAPFVVDGVVYTLDFTFNAYCEAETLLGMTFNEIMSAVQPGALQLGIFRMLFWSMLQAHHAPIDLIEAGDMISKAGLSAAMAAATRAIEAGGWIASMKAVEPQNPPRRARASTGKRS